MKVNANVDSARLLLRMEKGQKRFGFTVQDAINRTLKVAQGDVVGEVRKDFTLRPTKTPDFIVRRAAKIQFATLRGGRAYGEIFVDSGHVQGSPLLLPTFEEGGERHPVKGKRIAVPVIGGPARPTFASPVPDAFRFTKLNLRLTPRAETTDAEGKKKRHRIHRSDSRVAVRYGLQNTYMIPSVGVFQRTGGTPLTKRLHLGRAVYVFVDHEELPADLHFMQTVGKAIDTWFEEFLQRGIADVFAHHGAAA